MTEYCRLCAELKDFSEIVASIDDDEQLMEQKLRACCRWTTENTEQRLPHSVCSICSDKLDKCWLFSQSVQLAQQRLHEIFENDTEIETKPFIGEILPTVYESSECSNNSPTTSTAQSSRFNHQSFHEQRKQKPDHNCEICSHEFCTVAELNAHRQQGCVRLIEIGSIVMDCKPTAVDFKNSNSVVDRLEEEKPIVRNKSSQNQKKNDKAKQSDVRTSDKWFNRRQLQTGERPFKCPLCDSSYTANFNLSQHLISHALRSKGALKIEEFNEQFRIIQTNGGDPIDVPVKIKLRKCEDCDRRFGHKQSYEKHRASHSNERPFECWLCHKTFKTPQIIKAHMKIHTPGASKRTSICELCEKAFNSFADLTLHRQMVHSNRRYPCEICDKVYATASGLTRHRHVHTGKRLFKCPLCDTSYTTKYCLSQHLLSHALRSNGELKIEKINNKLRIIQTNGGDPIYISGKAKLFKCEDCDRILPNKKSFEEHRARHTNDRPFECWLCHKTFKIYRVAKEHSKIHVNVNVVKRNAVCELCGKAFKCTTSLSFHKQMLHSNERPFKCETCGLRFKIELQLKKHRLTHTELQFKCNKCEKTFRTNHSLKKHLETHTGSIAKPFVCEFCGIGFRDKRDLKDHRTIHTGEKPFKCEHCSSNFGARSSFYSHMRNVHGISLLAQKKEKMAKK